MELKNVFIIVAVLGGTLWAIKNQMQGPVTPEVVEATPIPKPAKKMDRYNLTPEAMRAVVTISGPDGAGTGFICNYGGRTLVVTNQIVLGFGNPLQLQTNGGEPLVPKNFAAAKDSDIALVHCASYPKDIKPLELAKLPSPEFTTGTWIIVPGNGNGDNLLSEVGGSVVTLGPQRVEVDNRVRPGHSGGPIVAATEQQVLGVLSEAEKLFLDDFSAASYHSGPSAIRSESRYFGQRLDAVQQWEALDFRVFQDTEATLRAARTELEALIFLVAGSADYKDFPDLRRAKSEATAMLTARNRSPADKVEASKKFVRDLESLALRARRRMEGRTLYFSQRRHVEAITRMSDALTKVMVVVRQDSQFAPNLLGGGL